MSEKNSHLNLPLETSWRDVLRVIHSKAKHDVQHTLVAAAGRSEPMLERIRVTRALAALSIVLLLAACRAPGVEKPASSAAQAASIAGVAAANPLAVQAGLEILRAGGSAVDAAVAVQATLVKAHGQDLFSVQNR